MPIDQWPVAAQMSYWGFHEQRRVHYMRYAYLQLGSDADAEGAVDLTFDRIMDHWLRMLEMESLEGYAWTILKRRIIDLHRKRRRRPELMETAAFEAALADHVEDPYDRLTDAITLYAAVSVLSERQRDAILLHYGIHTVGLLATVSPATVQRLLGKKAGRLAADRARGIDPRPVVPRALPASAAVRHRFTHHTLDGATVRAALHDLVVQLGLQLRRRDQAARALTLTLLFAGGTSWEKTRRLPEPSAHDEDLRTLAYQLMDAAGLQRGRLTGLVLKGEDLLDADQVAQQISLDTARESRLVAEQAMDRIRDKFGSGSVGSAAVMPFRHAS
ncbi:hypothetical protein [Streptomyces sp. AGS-58]|uniref:DinB/UmuC family translesion DNA polymerase n=1 Tax=unclassified Streptomyces TaxID=2593676 RepID=UPI0035A29531